MTAWSPAPFPRSYAFVDYDTGCKPGTMTSRDELARIAPGLQAQLREDVAPEWSPFSVADVVRANLDVPPAPGEGKIMLRMEPPPDQQGALALHDKDEHGVPIIWVFVGLLMQCGAELSPATSHELLESTPDPEGDAEATLPDGRVVAIEIADQVEAQTYKKNGVDVSNWNTKKNFGIAGGMDRFDFLGNQTSIFQCMAGGYQQVLTADGWQMITAERSPLGKYHDALAALGIGRRPKRARRHKARHDRIVRLLADIHGDAFPDRMQLTGAQVHAREIDLVRALLAEQRR